MPILINGKVKDSKGETLPNASVFVSDASGKISESNIGTTTDVNGNYSLIVAANSHVSASYTGFTKKTLSVPGANYDFELSESTVLKEFVVTAKRTPWLYIGLGGLVIGIIIYLIVGK